MTIGVLVITYNEEEMLEDCLESVKWADEIVVIDSDSNDRTREIAREYTDKVYIRDFDNFSNQRNFGLDKLKSNWILVLDADEQVTSELESEIKRVTASGNYALYQIPRKNFFLGKWIKYAGWYPDYTDRLFRNNQRIKYTGDVHESPSFAGKKGRLEQPMIHHTYKDISSYMEKVNHYTTLSAEESKKDPSLFYVLMRSFFEFFNFLILKKAFLHGKEGLVLTSVSTISKFLKYIKIWEKNRKD
ncbi:MAG: glycosyltransferase family 2 protein [bacterium]